jgi:CxxC motif-containing protein (DUF1111 family)
MHDGASLDIPTAITRHAGEASQVIQQYQGLSATDKAHLLSFLGSL